MIKRVTHHDLHKLLLACHVKGVAALGYPLFGDALWLQSAKFEHGAICTLAEVNEVLFHTLNCMQV
eukprot:3472141-Amphidinium_carterae.2